MAHAKRRMVNKKTWMIDKNGFPALRQPQQPNNPKGDFANTKHY